MHQFFYNICKTFYCPQITSIAVIYKLVHHKHGSGYFALHWVVMSFSGSLYVHSIFTITLEYSIFNVTDLKLYICFMFSNIASV